MLELYYAPFACSLASHILVKEGGLEARLVRVELSTGRTADGVELKTVNPKAQVPTLRLNDGRVLTENVAVLRYLADQHACLTPETEWGRYQALEWLAYFATEWHKGFYWFHYRPGAPTEAKEFLRPMFLKKLEWLDARLNGERFLVEGKFTAPDAYLTWALTLAPHAGVDLAPFPNLRAYYAEKLSRPAVRAALKFEQEAMAAAPA